MIRRRLVLWRRRRCLRRGHPAAPWSPICIEWTGPNGEVIQQRAWRCAVHDEPPT